MHKALLASLLLVILLSTNVVNLSLGVSPSFTERMPKEVMINAEMPINLVMVGDTWSEKDKENINNRLLKAYSPRILFENRTAGVAYNYTYNFDSVTQEKADQFFKFVDGVAKQVDIPPHIQAWIDSQSPSFWGPEFVEISKKKYKLINVGPVVDWIHENFELKDGYTMYFLKPSNKQINYWHTYGGDTMDPDTGIYFRQEGMMGFGGKYRFYFIDLMAGPWLYPYVPVSENQVIAQFHKNLYDVKTDEDYYEFIADYVNDAVTLLFTPSYLYSPIYKSNFQINIFLVDMTSGRTFRDVSGSYIDSATINHALKELIPYAEWSSDIRGSFFDILPRELQKVILKSRSVVKVPGGDIALVKSADLITELDRWVTSTATEEQLKLSQEEAERTVFVPVVIFVFDQRAYVDQIPVLGTAAPNPADQSTPCCAIVAVDRHALIDLGTGLSVTAIHEMGHVLGLRHPHDGYSQTKGEFVNWFYDWTSTPMSYTSPTGLGCGFPGLSCGLVVQEFGQFDHDSMDRALVLYLLNQVQLNLYESVSLLEKKGYRERILPDNIMSELSGIDLDAQTSMEHFTHMNYFNHTSFKSTANIMDPMDDSFDFALKALTGSQLLWKDISSVSEAPRTSTVTVADTSFVDVVGNELPGVMVGEHVSIKNRITNNSNQTVTCSYIVQIKGSNDYALSVTWLDNLEVKPEDSVEPSISWVPDETGELNVEIFVWESMANPIPLSEVKRTSVIVGE